MTALLILIYVSFISLGLPDSVLGAAWPSVYPAIGAPVEAAGMISMIVAGGTIVSSLASDRVIRRFGAGAVTAASTSMTAAALLGFSFSGSLAALCAFAVPLGLGAGSVDAALNNYVALHYEARHMNWLHCFWGLGASAGPVILSFFLARSGWSSGYRAIGLIQLTLAAVLFAALPLWRAQSSDEERAVSKALSPIGVVRLPRAVFSLTAFFCYCAIEQTAGLWGGSYLVLQAGFSPDAAARTVSLYYFGIMAGRFLSGFASSRLGSRRMITVGIDVLVCGVAFLAIGVPAAGLFLAGLGCAPVYPCLIHETPENFGADRSQSVIGVQMACAYVGTTCMPPLFGLAASRVGYRIFPAYLGVLLVGMALSIHALHRKRAEAPASEHASR